MNQNNNKNLKVKLSWAFYDWASSAWGTVITTFIFATYFTEVLSDNTEIGTIYWGNAIAISGFCIAILSPIIGSFVDRSQNIKKLLIFFTLIYSLCAFLLWFADPKNDKIFLILLLVVIGQVTSELAFTLYNAIIKIISDKKQYGKTSGLSWGLGYFGGLSILILILVLFVQSEDPILGLDKDNYEHIRICGPIVGLWIIFFSLPLFIYFKDDDNKSINYLDAFKSSLNQILSTIKEIRKYLNLVKFLIARMFYIDGINTVFAFGGIYAAGTFGMPFNQVILFGIGTNVAAGVGAIIFSFFEDILGSKKIIIFSLIVMTIFGLSILIVDEKNTFIILGISLSLFFGPIQSASRVYFAKNTPDEKKAEFFGFYSLSGKITAFLGPWLFAILTSIYSSQRAGMSSVIVFLVIGLFLMFFVKKDK